MAVTLRNAQERLQLPVSVDDETLAYHLAFVEAEVNEYVPLIAGVGQPRRDRAIIDLLQLSLGPTTETIVTAGGTTITRPPNINRRRNQILTRLVDPAMGLEDVAVVAQPAGEQIVVPSHPVHTGTHNRYIGWSNDTSIATADFATAAVFTSDRLVVPIRATDGYLWFGTGASAGYPNSIIFGNSPFNVLPLYLEQPGTITVQNEMYVVGVNTNLLNGPANSGITVTLGYQTP